MNNPLSSHAQKIARITHTNASAWVAANAGSGKTHVLTQRVIRLLLAGTPPEKILCLTFTRAAAAEMAARVFDTLKIWVNLDDAALKIAIETLTNAPASSRQLRHARRLFATALETPGGLKIQTLHAFCERVLQQFPFEAPVPTSFTLLDEPQIQTLWAGAFQKFYRSAGQIGSPFHADLKRLHSILGSAQLEMHLQGLLSKRDALLSFMLNHTTQSLELALRATLDVPPTQTLETLAKQLRDIPLTNPKMVHWLCQIFETGKDHDTKIATYLRESLAASSFNTRFAGLMKLVETQSGELLKKRSPTKDIVTQFPEHALFYETCIAQLLELRTHVYNFRAFEASLSAITVAIEVMKHYQAAKTAQRMLDFDDLVLKTRNLLLRADAAFVHYKLDGGIDHILVDEAQDTSHAQWDIIWQLSSEFFVGDAGRAKTRTVFVVGDEKQSIYRFQGAAPERFAHMKATFAHKITDAQLEWHEEPLQISFRTTPDVLALVDGVFAPRPRAQQLTTDATPVIHETQRRSSFGCVDVWPLCLPDTKHEITLTWEAATAPQQPRNAIHKMVQQIIYTIQDLLTAPHVVEGKNGAPRRITAGDILILVRARKGIFETLLKALRDAGIPVGGADRLTLTDNIAVQDLLALADCVLLPQDDLQLACALKSPILGLNEDDILAIAPQRSGTLLQALEARAHEQPHWGAALAQLHHLQALALTTRPYEFFMHMLSNTNGRVAFATRMGTDVHEILDEFLGLILKFEEQNVPDLFSFTQWIRTTSHILKREMSEASTAVRILTVHNAKGLEAPVVILADSCFDYRQQKAPKILFTQCNTPILTVHKHAAPPAFTTAKDAHNTAEYAETMRLLYVALTRARDRVFIFGAAGQKQANALEKNTIDIAMPTAWYTAIDAAVQAWGGTHEVIETPHGSFKRLRTTTAPLTVPTAQLPISAAECDAQLPPPAALHSIILPSSISVREAATLLMLPTCGGAGAPNFLLGVTEGGNVSKYEERIPPSASLHSAAPPQVGSLSIKNPALRGTIIHKLLELVPNLPDDAQLVAYITKTDPHAHAGAPQGIITEVRRTAALPALADVWNAPQRYAELPILGELLVNGTQQLISGRIDLLAITPTAHVIIDFKTEAYTGGIAPQYAAQLALYAQLLLHTLPTPHPIEARIVWTHSGHIESIPLNTIT